MFLSIKETEERVRERKRVIGGLQQNKMGYKMILRKTKCRTHI